MTRESSPEEVDAALTTASATSVRSELASFDVINDIDSLGPDARSVEPAPLKEPRYLARAEIGRGGMGRVVEAMDRRLGRVVAIKESFANDEDGRQRFEREVAITARLEHPSIVPLYDSGISGDGRAFYVMRKLSGRGLDLVMAELTSLDQRLALLPALLAACDAVAHAHARCVVHRDLKPGNILIGDHGETMVIDWGLAKAIGDSEPPRRGPRDGALDRLSPSSGPARSVKGSTAPPLPPDNLKTVVGSVFGTPGFMSPEQARGEQFDLRGDVYALGATLYHLLAGHPPHTGGSATEVIDRVRVEPPRPLSDVCAGAPVELVAIVDKAMSFEIAQRYPDAAALAGDLRRFLAGQLVAAHRYTLWQRLRRYARTHRAAIAVAGAALAVVAALSVVSLQRIVAERDQARAARADALLETHNAQAARDEAAARADELVVAQAHGLVPENPTAALALLKHLDPASSLWPKARMVAIGALAEGVARAVSGHGRRPPSIFTMSPHGDSVMVGEDSGQVWLLDLERMRARELVNVGSRPMGCWINDGASVLLSSQARGVVLREIDTGRTRAVPIRGEISTLACSGGGGVAYLDTEGGAWQLDAAFAQAHRLDIGQKAKDLEITADGAWLAIGGEREGLILDRDGATRRRFAGEVVSIVSSAKGRIAFMMRDRVIEVDPAAVAAAREYPLPKYSMSVFFVGERLRIMQATNRLSLADGTLDVDLPATVNSVAALGDRTTALGLSDGSVWLSGWWGARVMRTPATGTLLRLAGRPGSARLAAWSQGTVLVWNLGGAIPRLLPAELGIARLAFLGEDKLVAVGQSQVHWIDLATGTSERTSLDELPLFNAITVDPEQGQAMLVDGLVGRALLLRWSSKQAIGVWRDRASCAALLGDGAIAIGTTGGAVAVGKSERELTKLEMANPVAGLARLGLHGVIAIDSEGEVLTYDLPTGTIGRGSLGDAPSGPLIDDDQGGAIIALGTRLVRWQNGGMRELARLSEPVVQLARYRHLLVVLTTSEISTIDLAGDLTIRRIAAANRDQQVDNGSRWSISIGQRGMIELMDVATGVRWTKSIHGGLATFAVSPNGTRVVQQLGAEIALWSYDVPEEPVKLRAWLDEMTNAVVDGNLDVGWTAPGL
jgi:Protein kinase domain